MIRRMRTLLLSLTLVALMPMLSVASVPKVLVAEMFGAVW